jgi:hypothetical protein
VSAKYSPTCSAASPASAFPGEPFPRILSVGQQLFDFIRKSDTACDNSDVRAGARQPKWNSRRRPIGVFDADDTEFTRRIRHDALPSWKMSPLTLDGEVSLTVPTKTFRCSRIIDTSALVGNRAAGKSGNESCAARHETMIPAS